MKKKERIRIQLVVLPETQKMIQELCLLDNRNRSQVVDQAIKLYYDSKTTPVRNS